MRPPTPRHSHSTPALPPTLQGAAAQGRRENSRNVCKEDLSRPGAETLSAKVKVATRSHHTHRRGRRGDREKS